MDRYQQSRAKADLSDISQVFDADDMFTSWPAISEIISEKTKFVPPENKLFENENVTVLSLRKNGNAKMSAQKQGLAPGSCLAKVDGKHQPACQATLKYENGDIYRLITSVHLSRPENYLSIFRTL